MLLYAGFTKLFVPTWLPLRGAFVPGFEAFASIIVNQQVWPRALATPIAGLVIGIEVVTGLALMFGPAQRAACVGAIALLAAFSVYLWIARSIDAQVACGRLGAVTPESLSAHLVQNAALALIAWCGWALLGRRFDRIPPVSNADAAPLTAR